MAHCDFDMFEVRFQRCGSAYLISIATLVITSCFDTSTAGGVGGYQSGGAGAVASASSSASANAGSYASAGGSGTSKATGSGQAGQIGDFSVGNFDGNPSSGNGGANGGDKGLSFSLQKQVDVSGVTDDVTGIVGGILGGAGKLLVEVVGVGHGGSGVHGGGGGAAAGSSEGGTYGGNNGHGDAVNSDLGSSYGGSGGSGCGGTGGGYGGSGGAGGAAGVGAGSGYGGNGGSGSVAYDGLGGGYGGSSAGDTGGDSALILDGGGGGNGGGNQDSSGTKYGSVGGGLIILTQTSKTNPAGGDFGKSFPGSSASAAVFASANEGSSVILDGSNGEVGNGYPSTVSIGGGEKYKGREPGTAADNGPGNWQPGAASNGGDDAGIGNHGIGLGVGGPVPHSLTNDDVDLKAPSLHLPGISIQKHITIGVVDGGQVGVGGSEISGGPSGHAATGAVVNHPIDNGGSFGGGSGTTTGGVFSDANALSSSKADAGGVVGVVIGGLNGALNGRSLNCPGGACGDQGGIGAHGTGGCITGKCAGGGFGGSPGVSGGYGSSSASSTSYATASALASSSSSVKSGGNH